MTRGDRIKHGMVSFVYGQIWRFVSLMLPSASIVLLALGIGFYELSCTGIVKVIVQASQLTVPVQYCLSVIAPVYLFRSNSSPFQRQRKSLRGNMHACKLTSGM